MPDIHMPPVMPETEWTQFEPLPPGSVQRISVLLPTRGNPERLQFTIDRLLKLAKAPWQVEICVRADSNESVPYESWYGGEHSSVRVIRGKQGNGYWDMHRFQNEAARYATGGWLMLWWDDFEMRTKEWDQRLREVAVPENQKGCAVVQFEIVPGGPPWIAMACTRPVYEFFGYMAQHPYTDSWLNRLGEDANIVQRVPIQAYHMMIPRERPQQPQDVQGTAYQTSLKLDAQRLRHHLNGLHP